MRDELRPGPLASAGARRVILVTGSTGFIGRHLVRFLRRMCASVHLVGLDVNRPAQTECDDFFQRDITRDDLSEVMAQTGATDVVHLAALCKEPGFPWREYFEVNAEGTRRLLAATEGSAVRNIVFTSTMMVFAAGDWRRSEDDFCDPETAYGTSKLLAEEYLRAWRDRARGRRIRLIRPGVVFGPDDYGNMVRLIKALKSRRFAYIGRRDTVKGCIYVKDLVALIALLMDDAASNDLYHAVYPEPTPISSIVQAACGAWDIKRKPMLVPHWLAHTLAAPFALIDPFGKRFGVHPRRIEKLFHDTNISSRRLEAIQWAPRFTLTEAFKDWRKEERRF